jgi:hypothetical protein
VCRAFRLWRAGRAWSSGGRTPCRCYHHQGAAVRQDVPILTVGVPVGFVRFVETRRDGDSGVRAGLFDLAYRLRDDVEVPQYVRDQV